MPYHCTPTHPSLDLAPPQRTHAHGVMITSVLRQNDVATSFRRKTSNNVIVTSCVRWVWDIRRDLAIGRNYVILKRCPVKSQFMCRLPQKQFVKWKVKIIVVHRQPTTATVTVYNRKPKYRVEAIWKWRSQSAWWMLLLNIGNTT